MNVFNGMEEVHHWGPFATVAGLCALGTVATYNVVKDWTVLSSPAGKHTERVRKFVSSIGLEGPSSDVSGFASLVEGSARTATPLVVTATGSDRAKHLRLTREQFAALYYKATGVAIPMESVDIMFGIFDADADGALAMDEVLGVINKDGMIDPRALAALADSSEPDHLPPRV
jgi:hypothetical protein